MQAINVCFFTVYDNIYPLITKKWLKDQHWFFIAHIKPIMTPVIKKIIPPSSSSFFILFFFF